VTRDTTVYRRFTRRRYFLNLSILGLLDPRICTILYTPFIQYSNDRHVGMQLNVDQIE
jgi:hypothetical protein